MAFAHLALMFVHIAMVLLLMIALNATQDFISQNHFQLATNVMIPALLANPVEAAQLALLDTILVNTEDATNAK